MIIKGQSRTAPAALAAYLVNAEKNENVRVIEVTGTIATDLHGALVEMDACALATRCEKPLYHAQISPEPPYRLTDAQRDQTVNALEERLGMLGHARVVVIHEKLGREHIHVAWTRIDITQMRSVSLSHNYRAHEEVARELERKFGHPRVQGAHHERDGVERPDRSPSRAELRQQETTGIKGKAVKADVMDAYRSSDSPQAFVSGRRCKVGGCGCQGAHQPDQARFGSIMRRITDLITAIHAVNIIAFAANIRYNRCIFCGER